MSLKEYKRKRTFLKTPEPEGKPVGKAGTTAGPGRSNERKGKKLAFVVQKHAASHLHYDLRLEMKGTLKSWAVPKGPSMNPSDKRLAILVEDHPLDYKDFEGIIPKGNYGAGTVIIWDEGTYKPLEKASSKTEQEKILLKGFFSGSLRIRFDGKKLKGEFALVKSEGREDNAWLLIKKTDEYSGDIEITRKDRSVRSGKNMEQMAKDMNSKKWISNRSAGRRKNPIVKRAALTEESGREKDFEKIIEKIISGLKTKKKSKFPEDLKPMLATLVDMPFNDPDWTYEVKWDGYRALAYLDKGKVLIRSRNNNDFNEKFYPVFDALKKWPIKAVVDGEIVVVNEKGLANFSDLQQWRSEADGELMFYVFDILWLNGYELINLPLTQRREILSQLVPSEDIIRMSENFQASGTEFFAVAQKMGLEGIIAKKGQQHIST